MSKEEQNPNLPAGINLSNNNIANLEDVLPQIENKGEIEEVIKYFYLFLD